MDIVLCGLFSIWHCSRRRATKEICATNAHKQVKFLIKKQLTDLAAGRNDLVHRMCAWGATLPTTSMRWHKESHNLEWIVRHMSWAAPWIETDVRHDVAHFHRPSQQSGSATQASGVHRIDEQAMPNTGLDENHDVHIDAAAQAIPRVPHPRDVERRLVRKRNRREGK